MAWDCRYKAPDRECYRLGRKCAPGDKGCVLYGKFAFPFKEEEIEEEQTPETDTEEAEES